MCMGAIRLGGGERGTDEAEGTIGVAEEPRGESSGTARPFT